MFTFLQSEKRVKKLWLLFLVLPILSYVISWFFLVATLNGDSPIILGLKKLFLEPWILVLGLVLRLIPVWICSHCSYQKKGTALLSFIAWIYPIIMVYGFYIGIKGFYSLPTLEKAGLNDSAFTEFVTVGANFACIDLILNLCWYLLCFHLRNFNRQLQFDKVSETEKYLDTFYSLQNNSSKKELKYHYLLAKQKYPEVQYVFKMEYRKQKALLKNIPKTAQ